MIMSITNTTPLYSNGANRSAAVPSNIKDKGLLSNTGIAYECYANQKFSNMLQAYLINYVMNVNSSYSVFVRD